MEADNGLRPAFKGMLQYAQLAEIRHQTLSRLRTTKFADLISDTSLHKFSNSISFLSHDGELKLTINWLIHVNNDGHAEPDLSVAVQPSEKYISLDEQGLLERIPEKFLKLVEYKGVQVACETIIQILYG